MHNVSATVPETDYRCKLPCFLAFFGSSVNRKVRGTPRNTNATVFVEVLRRDDGRPTIRVDNVSVELGELSLVHTSDNSSPLGKIVDAVVWAFESVIKHIIESVVPERVKAVVENEVNGFLPTLPLVLREPPDIVDGRMSLSMDLLPNVLTGKVGLAPRVDDFARLPLPERDFALDASLTSLNNLLSHVMRQGAVTL
ncbi:hypothetical protein ERJ75_000413500 [Trypanosoma vivax]|nr:hypothetical protein ERJ75_000413500 [Trypanosoma vivax]